MESYSKDGRVVLLDDCGRFIYEVFIFVKYQNIYSLHGHKYFSSEKEITNVIDIFHVSNHISVECALYSAPLYWLKQNNFLPQINKNE